MFHCIHFVPRPVLPYIEVGIERLIIDFVATLRSHYTFLVTPV